MRAIISIVMSISMLAHPVLAQDPVSQVKPAYSHKGKTKKGHINNLSDKIYLSFPKDVQTLGPKFPLNEKENKKAAQEYVQWTFREIVRRAHSFIHDKGEFGYDPEGDVNFSYFSFLILALTVPHHESHLMHFRKQIGKKCSDRANQLKKSGYRTQKVLGDIYRISHEPILPNCSALKDLETLDQIIFSYTYEDLGIMQVNPYWHKVAMEPSVLLNTSNFIQYGVEFLFDGFMKVRKNLDKDNNYYSCSMAVDPYKTGKTTPKLFYNMLRATWASKYNAGSVKKICRFVSTNKYDDGFEAALRSVAVGATSIYHRYLPEDSLEMAALREITNNYYRIFVPGIQEEESENLQVLLNMSERRHQNWIPPQRIRQSEPEHTLAEALIPIYSEPGESEKTFCGYFDTRKQVGSPITVVNEEFYAIKDSPKPQRWAEVKVSPYATYLDLHGVMSFAQLREGKSVVNLRSVPGDLSEETKVGQMTRNSNGDSRRIRYVREVDVKGKTWIQMVGDFGEALYAHGDFVEKFDERIQPPESCDLDGLFIHSEHLRHMPVEYELGQSYKAVVNGVGGLNVRRAPGTQADKLDDKGIEAGDLVTVVGDDSDRGKRVVTWYQIILSDGRKGWVWQPRIDLIEKDDD